MRLDIICKVSDGGKNPAQILSLSKVRGQCGRTGFRTNSMVTEEPSNLSQQQTLRIGDVFQPYFFS